MDVFTSEQILTSVDEKIKFEPYLIQTKVHSFLYTIAVDICNIIINKSSVWSETIDAKISTKSFDSVDQHFIYVRYHLKCGHD